MLGVPAGFEDYSSDEDIDVEEIFEIDESKEFNQVQDLNASNKTSIFAQKSSFENVSQKISFEVEEMRIAVLKNDVRLVNELLNKGFKIEKLLPTGWSILMYAANNGCIEIVNILLERKSNPNFESDMFTPLMATCYSTKATEEKLLKCVESLVNAHAHIDSHDRYLMTALMYASKQGYAKIVDFLCKNGASINFQDTKGWTALSFASRHGYSHVAKVLLQHNADHLLTAFDGQTPADIAFAHNYKMMSEMLEKFNGSNIDQFKDVLSNRNNHSSTQPKYVKYGDLELFLHGLEMGHLVALFQEHNLSFTDMLKMTEEEMIEIGVTQLGLRKKLIDAIRTVHTNELEMSSLSIEVKNKLTLLECASVVANVTKHLRCIQSSVAYIKRHLKPNQLEFQSEHVNLQKALVEQCACAKEISEVLNNDIKELHLINTKMFQSIGEKPPELIERRDKRNFRISRPTLCLVLVGSAIVGGGILIRYKLSYSTLS